MRGGTEAVHDRRLASLRLSTRHEFRGPASLFTGREAKFNKAGLFSTNE